MLLLVLLVGCYFTLTSVALIQGTSRNPSLRKELFNTAILGFALTEALGLFALMMALIFLYAF